MLRLKKCACGGRFFQWKSIMQKYFSVARISETLLLWWSSLSWSRPSQVLYIHASNSFFQLQQQRYPMKRSHTSVSATLRVFRLYKAEEIDMRRVGCMPSTKMWGYFTGQLCVCVSRLEQYKYYKGLGEYYDSIWWANNPSNAVRLTVGGPQKSSDKSKLESLFS